MLILHSEEPWDCGPVTFDAGDYYVEAATAGTALSLNPGISVCTIDNPRPFDASQDWNDRLVLIPRLGGFGDNLFITPLIRAMKTKWPAMTLAVATAPYFRDALAGNPHIDRQDVTYPLRKESAEWFDAILWFEGLMEFDRRAHTTHAVDLHAEAAGVELCAGKHMEYHGHKPHLEAMRKRFPRGPRPRIGLQVSASARCRSYPGPLLTRVLVDLLEHYEVALFDRPLVGERPDKSHPRLLQLPAETPPLSFAESTAVLADCDVVIAPDSAMAHVAGALGLPTVALYGPFPAHLRTAYAESITPLQGKAPCAPCFWNERMAPWPEDGPCATTKRCEALAMIQPEQIVSAVRKKLRERIVLAS